ncbi:hypothetical protein Q3G72_019632 [Acer saccharum]|nr:hypothetical protein Q3G72_019632 [Acer saccharum]
MKKILALHLIYDEMSSDRPKIKLEIESIFDDHKRVDYHVMIGRDDDNDDDQTVGNHDNLFDPIVYQNERVVGSARQET